MAAYNKVIIAALCLLAVSSFSQALPQFQGYAPRPAVGAAMGAYNQASQVPARGYSAVQQTTRFQAQGSGPGGLNGAGGYGG